MREDKDLELANYRNPFLLLTDNLSTSSDLQILGPSCTPSPHPVPHDTTRLQNMETHRFIETP